MNFFDEIMAELWSIFPLEVYEIEDGEERRIK